MADDHHDEDRPDYDPEHVETKWQKIWVEQNAFACTSLIDALEEFLDPGAAVILRGEPASLPEWQSTCIAAAAPRNLCLAIPADAPHPDNAHAFINYMLRPEVAAKISMQIGYASPNRAARKLLPPEVTGNRILYPASTQLDNAEFLQYVGDAAAVYAHYWNRFKAAVDQRSENETY